MIFIDKRRLIRWLAVLVLCGLTACAPSGTEESKQTTVEQTTAMPETEETETTTEAPPVETTTEPQEPLVALNPSLMTEYTTEEGELYQEAINREVHDIPERIEIDGIVYWENDTYFGWGDWYPDMATYSRKDAIERGCVVVEVDAKRGIVYGKNIWEDFLDKVFQ